MTYTKTDLYGNHRSRGTFDDIYDSTKYATLEAAYQANDYVQVDYVRDENETLYMEAYHVQAPDDKKRRMLIIQQPFVGVDIQDDHEGCQMAASLFKPKQ